MYLVTYVVHSAYNLFTELDSQFQKIWKMNCEEHLLLSLNMIHVMPSAQECYGKSHKYAKVTIAISVLVN